MVCTMPTGHLAFLIMEQFLIGLAVTAGTALIDWGINGPLTQLTRKTKAKWDDKGVAAVKSVWKVVRGKINFRKK